MRPVYALSLLLPLSAQAQQAIIVDCKRNVQSGGILFGNMTLPIIPAKHRWTLVRYDPSERSDGVWQDGQCVVEEVMR